MGSFRTGLTILTAVAIGLALWVETTSQPQMPGSENVTWAINASRAMWADLRTQFTLLQLLALVTAPYIGISLFTFLFKPSRIEKSLVESDEAPKNLLRRYQNSGPVPYPYPNGWFCICISDDLKIGAVKHLSFLGQELALFRGEDGKARVMSAFCPHLGANLAIGGVVKKNCLTCPFHGWEFDGDDGKCVGIPYSQSIPSSAVTNTSVVAEANGVIYMWHHAAGEAPSWEVPILSDIGSWRYHCDGHSIHEVCAHIQEIPENGADNAHLNVLHTTPVVEFLGHLGFTHGWTADWKPVLEEGRKHLSEIHLVQCFRFLGKTIPLTTLDVTIQQIGPGIVILQFNTAVGTGYVVQSVTPKEAMVQSTIHSVHMPWWIPRIIGKGLLSSLVVQVERDVPIWNNKTFVPQPQLCKGDGKIGGFRRWYSQFYCMEQLARAKLNKSILDW